MERTLSFREDGSFRIMQLTDSHYEGDPSVDGKTRDLMARLVEWEKPDFIVHTGDAVWGERSEERLEAALEVLCASGIPWTFAFGNHDAEVLGNEKEILAHLMTMPGCVAFQGEDAGRVGDHVLRIRKGDQTRWALCVLNSGTGDAPGGGYLPMLRSQTDWYRAQVRAMEKESPDFGLLIFQHIAWPEYWDVWRYEETWGMRREGLSCPRVNGGLYAAALEAGHLRGVFVGHDHVNDFYGTLRGITLGYGRQSGYGSYSSPDYLRGCRMFEVREDNTEHFETWMRLEDGRVVRSPWHRLPMEKRADT